MLALCFRAIGVNKHLIHAGPSDSNSEAGTARVTTKSCTKPFELKMDGRVPAKDYDYKISYKDDVLNVKPHENHGHTDWAGLLSAGMMGAATLSQTMAENNAQIQEIRAQQQAAVQAQAQQVAQMQAQRAQQLAAQMRAAQQLALQEQALAARNSNQLSSEASGSQHTSGQSQGGRPEQRNDCLEILGTRTDNNFCSGDPALVVEFRNRCSSGIVYKFCTAHTDGSWSCGATNLDPGQEGSNGMQGCQYTGRYEHWAFIDEPGVNMYNYLPPDPR